MPIQIDSIPSFSLLRERTPAITNPIFLLGANESIGIPIFDYFCCRGVVQVDLSSVVFQRNEDVPRLAITTDEMIRYAGLETVWE